MSTLLFYDKDWSLKNRRDELLKIHSYHKKNKSFHKADSQDSPNLQ